ncbi:hypothetical protein FV218_10975 [Methylobacterium sp. WL69]|uniref:hypothetical protein n=1 Tax=Methylobacterium sp. WL69 TaxID=2603893 RepID=UPI0011CB0F68|nr:hypothetical protein [Methylobacterium sp. WL69]TXM73729.1 hypothetical protein FV218_10975 [Methylobacterium sp. WL69]
MPPPTKIETAYHEAGHAVLAHRSHYVRIKPTSSVSIVQVDDEHGGVDVETDPGAPSTTDHRMAYEMAIVGAAGFSAQRRYLKDNNELINDDAINAGARSDANGVREYFGARVFFEFVHAVEFRFQYNEVWEQVVLLAEALMKNETLTFDEVEAVIGPR